MKALIRNIKNWNAIEIILAILLIASCITLIIAIVYSINNGTASSAGHHGMNHVIIINGKPVILYY